MKSTVLTNLQRGNIEAKIRTKIDLTFFERCAQGEVSEDEIQLCKDIDTLDESGFSALHWASFYGQLKTCSLLLDFGANANVMANNFVSPLHLAASSGHHEVIKLLLSKGANVSQMDINGNTPLHFAAANNHPHSTNELLNFADVMLTNEDSKTAYHVAVEKRALLSQTVIENFIGNSIKN